MDMPRPVTALRAFPRRGSAPAPRQLLKKLDQNFYSRSAPFYPQKKDCRTAAALFSFSSQRRLAKLRRFVKLTPSASAWTG